LFYWNTAPTFYGSGLPAGIGLVNCTNANGDPCDAYFNLFLDPLLDGFYLTEDSPCIDAGDPNSAPDPDGSITDMGAHYYLSTTTGDLPAQENMPAAVKLISLAPNPFNENTDLTFSLAKAGLVTIRLYDINGRAEAIQHIEGAAGINCYRISAAGLASGVYFLSVNALQQSCVEKVILLK